jgi:hypothetical protein
VRRILFLWLLQFSELNGLRQWLTQSLKSLLKYIKHLKSNFRSLYDKSENKMWLENNELDFFFGIFFATMYKEALSFSVSLLPIPKY